MADSSLHHNCLSTSQSLKKLIKDLPKHTQLKVQLNFHFLDQWEGEQAYLKINDQVVWTKKHNWCNNIFAKVCMENGVDFCGRNYPDTFGYLVSQIMPFDVAGDSFFLEIGSTLKGNDCKANWGIDNLMIFVR